MLVAGLCPAIVNGVFRTVILPSLALPIRMCLMGLIVATIVHFGLGDRIATLLSNGKCSKFLGLCSRSFHPESVCSKLCKPCSSGSNCNTGACLLGFSCGCHACAVGVYVGTGSSVCFASDRLPYMVQWYIYKYTIEPGVQLRSSL